MPDNSAESIVIAHSASGLFLPLVAEQRQVARLVFLAAVIPKIGASLLDQVRGEPGMFNPEWLGKDPTKDDAVAVQFLFHDCSPEVASWALGTRRLSILRWVQHYSPEFEKRWKRYARSVGGSWRMDETYIRVKGEWMYLYVCPLAMAGEDTTIHTVAIGHIGNPPEFRSVPDPRFREDEYGVTGGAGTGSDSRHNH